MKRQRRRLFLGVILIVTILFFIPGFICPFLAKKHYWKQTNEKGWLGNDLISFNENLFILRGPLIQNNNEIIGYIVYCDTRTLIILSFLDYNVGIFKII